MQILPFQSVLLTELTIFPLTAADLVGPRAL